MLRFTIRDILWLTVAVGLAIAWRQVAGQRQHGLQELKAIQPVVEKQQQELDAIELEVTNKSLGTLKRWAKKRRNTREKEEALAGKYDPDKALVGEWELVEMIFRGKVQDFQGFQGRPAGWMTFQYGKWSEAYSDHQYVTHYDYKIVGPGELDIELKGLPWRSGEMMKCRYELKDGSLRFICSTVDLDERPADFEALANPRVKLYVLRKVN